MITRMYYVRCDECGTPAGGQDEIEFTPADARRAARRLGWVSVPGRQFRRETLDHCPTCIAAHPHATPEPTP